MARRFIPVSPGLLPKDDPRYLGWLKSLKKRPPPWNKGKTKFDSLSVKKISDTFKKNKIDNFRNWRNIAKKSGLIPDSDKPLSKSEKLAFLIGLVLGDGNLYKFPRTEGLRITLGTDKPLLISYSAKILRDVIRKNATIIKRSKNNCVNVTLYQKNLSRRLGIPSGARKNLSIRLPPWIWNKKIFLISALKGLFEAEGSFSIHEKTYTYNLSFSNSNMSLLNEVEAALILLGFHPERRPKAVRLRKKKEALEFEQVINFRKYPAIIRPS